MSNQINYICVVGYGWSGSSAVIDLLKEFEGVWDSEAEFRILKDAHGMMDLEHALIEKWDALNVDIAIRDFLELAKLLNQNGGKFQRGLNYDRIFSGNFMHATETFVEEITEYKYKGYWWMFDLRKNYFKWLGRKLANKVAPREYVENMYFSGVEKTTFYSAVKKYMNSLINEISKGVVCSTIVLDQAVPAQHPEKAFDYFDNAKVIVVDRDPRDIFLDLVELKKLVGRDIAEIHDVQKYVKWHKKYRDSGCVNHPNILRLNFEDVVLNYEESVKKIAEFVGVELIHHTKKYEFFKPEESKKNIGKYISYPYQEEIQVLERELSDYLYCNR